MIKTITTQSSEDFEKQMDELESTYHIEKEHYHIHPLVHAQPVTSEHIELPKGVKVNALDVKINIIYFAVFRVTPRADMAIAMTDEIAEEIKAEQAKNGEKKTEGAASAGKE